MKTKFYLFVLLSFVGFIPCMFGQQGNSSKGTDSSKLETEIPVYNLYYLSKALSQPNISYAQKLMFRNALIGLIGIDNVAKITINLEAYKRLSQFTEGITDYEKYIGQYLFNLLKNGEFVRFRQESKAIFPPNNPEAILKQLESDYESYSKNKNINSEETLLLSKFVNRDSIITPRDTVELSKIIKVVRSGDSINQEETRAQIERKYNSIDSIFKKNMKYVSDVDKLVKGLGDLKKSHVNQVNKNLENYIVEAQVKAQTQIQLNATIQAAQSGGSSSTGISLPSESQIINAMAIFLANRAKQEAVIWFMDQIRSKLDNPMVSDVFPETIKMIDELENYKAPNFSASWRYAIAKDFAGLPVNLVNSPWVKDVIVKNQDHLERLKAGVELGNTLNRLMAQQYNYRDIIRYFYLNPMNTKEEKTGVNKSINNSFKILYIITNELFAIDNVDGKNVYRLLSYEEIQSLSNEQFQTLLELIDLKYGDPSGSILNAKSDKNKENLSKWVGNLLMSLAQFDKIKNDMKQSQGQNRLDLSNLNLGSVWKILLQIVDNLNSSEILAGNQIGESLKFIKSSLAIYEDLQSNNFLAAAKSTLSLIELAYYSANKPNLEKDSIVYNRDFLNMQSICIRCNASKVNGCNAFKIKRGTSDSVFLKIDQKASVLSISDNSDFKGSDSLNVKTFSKILPLIKYLTEKGDTYNLIKGQMDLSSLKFNQLRGYSKKIGVDEIALLQMINYVYSISKNDNDPVASQKIRGVLDKLLPATTTKSDIQEYNSKYSDQLIKLLSFFGDVLVSKDEKDLANVIESYALPPTSYKLKRRMACSIDLNAYVGAYGGFLLARSTSSFDNQPVYGVTAPIGVALTKTTSCWIDHFGITLDAFDLGNLVNHYLISPNTEYGKEVHFSEIFSPGFSFIGGIRNTPFVIYAGVRWQPLKTFTKGDVVYNNKAFDVAVIHAGIKIDIPLMNLKSKGRK